MNLNHMLVFAKVAEHQSFTKAGHDLGMEKSNVSSKISQLERQLGVRLLNRTTRSVTLTEAGQGYYQYCAQIVEKAEEADQFLEALAAEPQGTLRITAPIDFGRIMLETLIKPYLEEYPKVKVEMCFTDRMVDLIRGRFDLAFRRSAYLLRDSSLIARKVFSTKLGLYASPAFIEEQGFPNTIEDLCELDMITRTPEEEFDKPVNIQVGVGKQKLTLPSRGRIKVSDMGTHIHATKLGLGVALIPEVMIQKELRENKLMPLLTEIKWPEANLFAVYPSREWMPEKLRGFLDFLDNWIPA